MNIQKMSFNNNFEVNEIVAMEYFNVAWVMKDVKINRIIFSVDTQGQWVSFDVVDNDGVEYKNVSETKLYKKSKDGKTLESY